MVYYRSMGIADDRADKTAQPRRGGRAALNFWVDIATGVVFAAMVGSGLLAKWILPPGSRGGTGLIWLGQGRHFWGDVHFWLGAAMLALVIVHIWLHWGWVTGTWARLVGRLGSPLTWPLLALLAALMALPLLIPRQYSTDHAAEHERQEEQSNEKAAAERSGG